MDIDAANIPNGYIQLRRYHKGKLVFLNYLSSVSHCLLLYLNNFSFKHHDIKLNKNIHKLFYDGYQFRTVNLLEKENNM